MSRLEIASPNRARIVMEGLYKDLERRIESSPPGLCPVDMARAFLDLCHAQTCGKCVPCRIGLGQLSHFMEDVLNGKATMETLDIMEQTALSIMESADCAIGYEAADMVYKGLIGYRDDYIGHIQNNRCTCTYNQPVSCVSLCPAHVDIPGYIALVGEGRYQDAIRLIRKDNPFPTTCGFICEHPCEARCRRNMVDDSVNIRGLKRVAADFAGEVDPPACAPATGKRVAVLGGGPGGLSAAYYLQLMGHQATVYEMLPELGGMLRYGIPNYRLPKNRLDEDIRSILKTGVEVKHGLKIGQDITIQELREQYDAVLITIGASTDKKLGLEGEDAEGVLSAVQFLRNVGKHEIMDLTTLKAPASIVVDEQNHVKGIYVTPQMVSAIRDGRASIRPTGEEDLYIPCDVLIKAIGQNIETRHFEEAGIPVARGRIVTKRSGTFANMPGVFAGGDCASGPASVISAIAAAKVVAANIDEYLGYRHEISCDVKIPEPRLNDNTPCGRVNLTEREACERIRDFEGVENCMTEEEAKQEANRCLRCDHFGYGIFKGGRETLW